MLREGILQEMISKALDLDIRDILRIPEEAIRDILLLNIQIDLSNSSPTSMRMSVSLNCLVSSSFSLKLSPKVITQSSFSSSKSGLIFLPSLMKDCRYLLVVWQNCSGSRESWDQGQRRKGGIHRPYYNISIKGYESWKGGYPCGDDPLLAFLHDALARALGEVLLGEIAQYILLSLLDLHKIHHTSCAKLEMLMSNFFTIFSQSLRTILSFSSPFLYFFQRHCSICVLKSCARCRRERVARSREQKSSCELLMLPSLNFQRKSSQPASNSNSRT